MYYAVVFSDCALGRDGGVGGGGSFVHFGHHRTSVIPEHFRCLVRGMEPSGSGASKCPAAARKLIPPDSNKTVRQQSASAAAGSPCFSGKRSICRYTCCHEQPGPLSATRCCSGGCDDLYIFDFHAGGVAWTAPADAPPQASPRVMALAFKQVLDT